MTSGLHGYKIVGIVGVPEALGSFRYQINHLGLTSAVIRRTSTHAKERHCAHVKT